MTAPRSPWPSLFATCSAVPIYNWVRSQRGRKIKGWFHSEDEPCMLVSGEMERCTDRERERETKIFGYATINRQQQDSSLYLNLGLSINGGNPNHLRSWSLLLGKGKPTIYGQPHSTLGTCPEAFPAVQRWDISLNRVSQCPLLGTKVDLVWSMIHLYVLTIATIGMSRD